MWKCEKGKPSLQSVFYQWAFSVFHIRPRTWIKRIKPGRFHIFFGSIKKRIRYFYIYRLRNISINFKPNQSFQILPSSQRLSKVEFTLQKLSMQQLKSTFIFLSKLNDFPCERVLEIAHFFCRKCCFISYLHKSF